MQFIINKGMTSDSVNLFNVFKLEFGEIFRKKLVLGAFALGEI